MSEPLRFDWDAQPSDEAVDHEIIPWAEGKTTTRTRWRIKEH